MSKLQLFCDFVNERLAAASLEICWQYETTLAECQEEICRSRETIAQLQTMLDREPEIKLHRTDVQQLSLPEPPQIKEEQELWTSHEGEQLQLSPLDQSPSVENRDCLSTHKAEEQIKAESNEENYGAPEPDSDSQPPSLTPECPTAQSLEEEEKGDPLPDSKSIKSKTTQAKCSRPFHSPCPRPGPCLRTKISPWTKPIISSCSESESEDVFSGDTESKTAEKLYKCEECDKAYSQRGNLIVHIRVHTGEKPYQCQECDKAFSRKSDLVKHRRTHTGEKPYQCEECEKYFSQQCHLVSHRQMHTGEKPYQCEDCDKWFSRQSNLVRHRRLHTGEKPYRCQECDKAFSVKGDLVSHRHMHTGGKTYQCEDCDKWFSQQNNLVRHRRRRHTGEKPYQCQECDKAFSVKCDLVKHRRKHTGEKPYQCEECEKAFSQQCHLVSHRRIHTGEKPYKCGKCDKAFSRQDSLVCHIRRIHT